MKPKTVDIAYGIVHAVDDMPAKKFEKALNAMYNSGEIDEVGDFHIIAEHLLDLARAAYRVSEQSRL